MSWALGPGVRRVVGDDELERVGADGDVTVLRPWSPGRDIAVLHETGPRPRVLVHEADRLAWLAGRAAAPELIASGRTDDGDEALAVRIAADAISLDRRPAVDPVGFTGSLARALRAVHELTPGPEPADAGPGRLRDAIADRVAGGEVADAARGPYAGRTPGELLGLLDRLVGRLDDTAPVLVHAGLTAARIWVAPDDEVTFTGWHGAGIGDRHLDLAGAAVAVHEALGPTAVAPLLDAYGLDDVDPVALDCYQLVVHLLR